MRSAHVKDVGRIPTRRQCRALLQSNRPFALKTLQKAQVVAFKQQTNIMNEKNVMMMVDHPFVLKLEATFKDANCLYMLLEFVQGGELFTLLANQETGRLTIPHAKYVCTSVVGCVAMPCPS